MMDLQAAIGIHQMKRVAPYWKRREQIWQRYNEAFADLPITLPANPEFDTSRDFFRRKRTGIALYQEVPRNYFIGFYSNFVEQ